jgi:uncharacterized membrane protein YsdA (DUF1294 family)
LEGAVFDERFPLDTRTSKVRELLLSHKILKPRGESYFWFFIIIIIIIIIHCYNSDPQQEEEQKLKLKSLLSCSLSALIGRGMFLLSSKRPSFIGSYTYLILLLIRSIILY